MADILGENPPTPSVLMELREERDVVREGFQFLDEKRLLLAAEVLRQLERYELLHQHFLDLHAQAAKALEKTVFRHGLESVQLYPTAPLADAQLAFRTRTFLGVMLLDADLAPEEGESPPPTLDPSPEARGAANLYRQLIFTGPKLAALAGNVERLLHEYRRTERRARALEDVILPEIETALQEVATRLEELEQEEALRGRRLT